jgi:addiction module RelB/DinJ family antitoxin
MTNTAVIQIRTDPKLKEQAQAVADELGFSLSSLIKAFLKNVTKTKSVTFTTDERPSPWLVKQIKQAEKDIKSDDYHSFDNNEKALKFLNNSLK